MTIDIHTKIWIFGSLLNFLLISRLRTELILIDWLWSRTVW